MLSADWLVPDWPAPPGVHAVFTTRAGGVSGAPWDSMNLGDHVGDVPADVAANRAGLSAALGAKAVFLQQVHGTVTLELNHRSADGSVADACLTPHAGVVCTIMVADCLPVLLTTRCGSVVGAVHAGWRGLVGTAGTAPGASGGVLASIYASISAVARANIAGSATELIAWLGPSIGPDAFEVGPEVKAAFESADPSLAGCFQPAGFGKFKADLAGLARMRLRALGVTATFGNDSSAAWCTVSNPSRFFSHRRDAGPFGNGAFTTGRMAACIWKD